MNRKYKNKICLNCNSVFNPRNNRDTLCIMCRTKICQTCGKKYTVKTAQALSNSKYCSKNCLYETRVYKHKCKNCNEMFSSKSSTAEYCNLCKARQCKTCGKSYIIKPYQKNSKYCSKQCHDKAQYNYIFTDEDISFIKNNYPFNISMKEIALKYNTSVSSVNRIISKLELPKCPISLRNQRSGLSHRYWTEDKIIEKIQSLHADGENLNSSNIQKIYNSFHNSACIRFGSWKNAIESAGLNYDKINLYSHRTTWSIEEIINRINELFKNNENLMASNIRDNYADLFNAARREPKLGSWEAAIKLAGLNYDDICGEKWGNRYKSIDGKTYESIIEGKVADELYLMKEKEIIQDYKSQVRICKNRRWTCDFLIIKNNEEIWLEVDGLEESRKEGQYNVKNEKIDYYKKNNFNYKIITKIEQLNKTI